MDDPNRQLSEAEIAELLAEYRTVMEWARPRLLGHKDDLRRLADADPHTYTRDDRALVKAALLYVVARLLTDNL
jgi:hypothetical protein